jgi:hypothetical protein
MDPYRAPAVASLTTSLKFAGFVKALEMSAFTHIWPHCGRVPRIRRVRYVSCSAVSLEFLVVSLIVVATPGTGVLYTVAAGLARGGRASVVSALGARSGSFRTWWRRSRALWRCCTRVQQPSRFSSTWVWPTSSTWPGAREGQGRARGRGGHRAPLGGKRDRVRRPGQHPQSDADDLLLRVPAPVL